MRILSFSVKRFDRKYLFAFIITLICSVICGIVLYKTAFNNVYFINFGNDYVYNVFSFNNSPLFFTHLVADAVYFYSFFLICYFTKLKYLTLVFLYIRGLFFGIYAAVLFCITALSGFLVALLVFIPATLISVVVCYFICEECVRCDKKYVFIFPAVLAVTDGIILMLLVNVVFRIIILIV